MKLDARDNKQQLIAEWGAAMTPRVLFLALFLLLTGVPALQAQPATPPPVPDYSFVAPNGKTVFRHGDSYFINACDQPSRPRDMRCYAKLLSNADGIPLATTTTIKGYKAADLRSAYGLGAVPAAPVFDASTPVVAIVLPYDYAKLEANMAAYRQAMGLPPCPSTGTYPCFSRVYQNGVKPPAPPAGSNWGVEASLDVQMVSAICPQCRIRVYESTGADSSYMSRMVELAASDPGVIAISNSYGTTESNWFADPNIANDAARIQASGAALVYASGDSGYGVNCPACLNTVLAVGGTTLTKTTTGRLWAETAWNKAGSGCDRDAGSLYARPAWSDPAAMLMPPQSTCTRRMVADVSAVADPATGVAVYAPCGFGGLLFGSVSWCVAGGTSAAAPIWAGLIGARGRIADAAYPAECAGVTSQNRIGCFLYYKAAVKSGATYSYNSANAQLNDVTSGSNGSCSSSILCTAKAGYDGPSGLGTPRPAALTNTPNP